MATDVRMRPSLGFAPIDHRRGPVSFPPVSVPDHRGQTQQGYDTVAADYARLLPAMNAETSLDIAVIDGFADRCARARLGPVADAGCGTGRVSAHLAARGLDVIGIDLSPGMVEAARRTYPELHFEVGALEELPLPDASLGGLLDWCSIIADQWPAAKVGGIPLAMIQAKTVIAAAVPRHLQAVGSGTDLRVRQWMGQVRVGGRHLVQGESRSP